MVIEYKEIPVNPPQIILPWESPEHAMERRGYKELFFGKNEKVDPFVEGTYTLASHAGSHVRRVFYSLTVASTEARLFVTPKNERDSYTRHYIETPRGNIVGRRGKWRYMLEYEQGGKNAFPIISKDRQSNFFVESLLIWYRKLF